MKIIISIIILIAFVGTYFFLKSNDSHDDVHHIDSHHESGTHADESDHKIDEMAKKAAEEARKITLEELNKLLQTQKEHTAQIEDTINTLKQGLEVFNRSEESAKEKFEKLVSASGNWGKAEKVGKELRLRVAENKYLKIGKQIDAAKEEISKLENSYQQALSSQKETEARIAELNN